MVTARSALYCFFKVTQLNILLQNLAPTYEQLADAFAHAKDKVVIAKVDADGVGKPLGKKYDVSGFPSMCLRYCRHGPC